MTHEVTTECSRYSLRSFLVQNEQRFSAWPGGVSPYTSAKRPLCKLLESLFLCSFFLTDTLRTNSSLLNLPPILSLDVLNSEDHCPIFGFLPHCIVFHMCLEMKLEWWQDSVWVFPPPSGVVGLRYCCCCRCPVCKPVVAYITSNFLVVYSQRESSVPPTLSLLSWHKWRYGGWC